MSIWDQDSLLSSEFEDFAFMNRTTVPDGYGGFHEAYTQGAAFKGVLISDQSSVVRAAGAEKSVPILTLKIPKNVPLKFPDIFTRLSDGAFFRVTDKYGQKTPDSSEIDVRQVPVEEWSLPNG